MAAQWECEERGCWPTLYLIGAQQTATTSIFNMLQQNQLICGHTSEIGHEDHRIKETHFFDEPTYWNGEWDDVLNGTDALRNYLSGYRKENCKAGVHMDATPSYLREYQGPTRMKHTIPISIQMNKMRMLVVLREPISRDLSYYNMMHGLWIRGGRNG
jgi:hypothetical protein